MATYSSWVSGSHQSGLVLPTHFGAGDDVEQVELDRVNGFCCYSPHRLEHHRTILLWQSVNEMDAHPDSPFMERPNRCLKLSIGVAAIDALPGCIKGRLKAELNGEVGIGRAIVAR